MSRPNVLYVTIDSIRADHIGHHDYDRPTTPTIDRLADRGTACTRTFANGIPTYYSFKSLLGGVPSLGHERGIGLPDAATPVAERFRGAGYCTAGISAGNPWLTPGYGYDRGFDTFRDFLTGDDADGSNFDDWFRTAQHRVQDLAESSEFVKDKAGLAARTFCTFTGRTPLEPAEPTTDAVLEWLDRVPDDEPFFLWIHYMDPHYPWTPRDEDLAPFSSDSFSKLEISKLWHRVSYLNKAEGADGVSQRDIQRINDLYDAEIRRTDAAIGRVLDALRADGRFDDTLVAVVGDHGTELNDHGGFSHGPRTLYSEITHVPLVFAGPGVPSRTHDDAVSLLDVVPSLLSLAGIDTDTPGTGADEGVGADPNVGGTGMDPLPGVSLFDADGDDPADPVKERDRAFTEVVYDFEPASGDNADNGLLVSCVDWPWKLIRNHETGTTELYHLERDPDERADCADERSDVVERLSATLNQYRDSVERQNHTVREKIRVRNRVDQLKRRGEI